MIKSDHRSLPIVDFTNKDLVTSFLASNNFTLKVSDNLELIKEVLSSQSEDDYPYRFDAAFNRDYIRDYNFFCLFLKHKSEIIATYAAREVNLKDYLNDMRNYFSEDSVSTNVELEMRNFNTIWYSSLQWVNSNYRGKNIGLILDFIKKSIVFECFNGDTNFSTHTISLNDYHKNKLLYNNTEWFMSIVNGEAGRKNDKSVKVYNISYIEKQHWNNIKDEIYNYYIPTK